MLIKKLFIVLIQLCAIYAGLCTPIHAVSEFATSYHNSYSYNPSGYLEVTHTITLTNKLSHIYPTVFDLSLSGPEPDNLKVKISNLESAYEVDATATTTSIHIPIPSATIGQGKSTVLSVSYTTPTLIEVIGGSYNLTLPKIARANEAGSFVREVTVPDSLPELTYSSLPAQSEQNSGNSRLYRFVGSGERTLTLQFGTHSYYDLELSYVLKNPNSAPAISELALPPDTAYQRVIINSLNPVPTEIVLDSDGNFLARYPLNPLEQKNIKAELTLIVSPAPVFVDPSSSAPLSEVKYWEQNSAVKQLATQLKSPRNLYDYLTTNLKYDYSKISSNTRLGAAKTLESPYNSICTEFSDLFVAVSRSMGIPSRMLIGYAYTTNTANPSFRPEGSNLDILHAFAEYQNPETKVWHSVDPTWGHTTGGGEYFDRLDFAHLTFVRLGLDSSYPLPAGSYRSDDSPQIKVSVRKTPVELPEPEYKPVLVDGQNYLKNTGRVALVNQEVMLADRAITIRYLPPYALMPLPDSAKAPLKLLTSNLSLLLVLPLLALLVFIIRRRMVR